MVSKFVLLKAIVRYSGILPFIMLVNDCLVCLHFCLITISSSDMCSFYPSDTQVLRRELARAKTAVGSYAPWRTQPLLPQGGAPVC